MTDPLPQHILDPLDAESMADLDQSAVSYLLPVIRQEGVCFRAEYNVGIGTLHIQGSKGHQWAEIHALDDRRHFLHGRWGSMHTRFQQQPPRRLRARFAPKGLDETHLMPDDLMWTGLYGGPLPDGLPLHATTVLDSGVGFLLGSYTSLKLEEGYFEKTE